MEGSINTKVNRGRGGTYWLAVTTDSQDVQIINKFNQLMASLNYRAFPPKSRKPAWTKQVIPTNIDNIEGEISKVASDIGMIANLAGLEFIKTDFTSLEQKQPEVSNTQPQIGVEGQPTEQSEATDTIESFVSKLKKEMATTPADEQAKSMTDMIAQQLDTLASSVDEVKKQGFIKDFLEFASKFWNYSMSNQMLIYFQTNGKAEFVKGRKQWEELGRKVKADASPISILAPSAAGTKVDAQGLGMILSYVNYYLGSFPSEIDLTKSNNIRKFLGLAKKRVAGRRYFYLLNLFNAKRFKNVSDIKIYLDNKATKGEGDSSSSFSKFKAVQVFDYNDTDPLPGYTGKIFVPPTKDIWQSKYNTEDEKSTSVINAALKIADEKGIEVRIEDTGSSGGWASGGNKIGIHYQSQGQRKLSTIIHEIAHSFLHFGDDRRSSNRLEKEIDAESVTYIVMKHFGFEADYAPNYLALSGATSKEIKGRRDTITKAVKEILTGLHKYLLGEENKVASYKGWYKEAKRKSYSFENTFIPVIYYSFTSDN